MKGPGTLHVAGGRRQTSPWKKAKERKNKYTAYNTELSTPYGQKPPTKNMGYHIRSDHGDRDPHKRKYS